MSNSTTEGSCECHMSNSTMSNSLSVFQLKAKASINYSTSNNRSHCSYACRNANAKLIPPLMWRELKSGTDFPVIEAHYKRRVCTLREG